MSVEPKIRPVAHFDEKTASADELWKWCRQEYDNPNPIVQHLLNKFFSRLGDILSILEETDKVLEVGCGAGASSLRILEMLAGPTLEVSDIDGRYVEKLKASGFPLPVQQESVLQLKREDHSYDCVLLLEVLEHLQEYDLALSELFRVSRKYVVISVPNEPLWRILNVARWKYLGEWGNTPGHINHWSPLKLSKLVSKYGTVVRVDTPLPWTIVLARVNSRH